MAAKAAARTNYEADASASSLDHLVDLIRCCENHVGAVSHHAGRHDRGRAAFRPILAGIGLEAEVALPKGVCLVVGGGHAIGVAAIRDCLDPFVRLQPL